MKHSADVIIVGGGIIGCAAAYYLAKRGVSVLVLEGSSYIGNGGFLQKRRRCPPVRT